MKKFLNISLYALVTLIGFAFTACDDDDDSGVAKAVLASTGNLTYEATSAPGQIITVYSDATWICEHPDWVTVEPETGSGTTEVRITVTDNLRDGTPDNPRKADVVFKGVTKASEAHVIVRQDGDKFRDVLPITIEQMEQNEEESVAIINNLTVVAPLSGALIATDGTNNVYITTSETKAAGDVVTVYGEKGIDSNLLSVVKADYFTDGGTAATLPAPVAITGADVDGKTFGNRQYLTVTGIVDGKNLNVDGAETIHVVVTEAAAGLDWPALNGHEVTLRGFYCGTASPAFNMIAESADDLGVHEVIYWSEDFEWLNDWAVGAGAGRTVEEDNLDATAPALTSVKAVVDGVEMTCFDFIESKGFTFVYDKDDNKRTYLQRNYLKFGKTGNHSGIILPSINTVPSDEHCILKFDWCPMRQGSGKIDPVNLYVEFDNGGDVVRIDIPECGWENGHVLEWITASVDLKGIKVNASTKITISQTQWGVGTANRWFLDNIRIVKADD